MKGQLYIDGKDASDYGMISIWGSYNELVAFPNSKTPDSNDWAEEDGKEFDLSAIALDSKDVTLEFGFFDEWKFNDFVALLSDMGYHDFNFPQLGRTFRLRLSSQSSFEMFNSSERSKFVFAHDFPPPADYVYEEPVNLYTMSKGYELDDVDLSAYGVILLKGSNQEILKSPAVKKNLLQNFKYQDGAIYDGQFVKFQTKDVNLKCLMRAPDFDTFWRNRDALLYDFTRLSVKTDAEGYEYEDAERIFYVDEWSESYPCYYKSCKTEHFNPLGGIWWEFTLTLVFTSFRLGDTEYLLASESGEFIITEDEECFIDLGD